MLTFTEAQVLAWVTPVLWPTVRLLALLGTLPVIAQRAAPTRVRIALAFFVVLCAQGSLPPIEPVPLDSPQALLRLLHEMVVGITMGFSIRIVFSAVELAGEVIGLQMGLNFAGFFDPATGGQTTAMSRFFGVCVGWTFIASDSHLFMVSALVHSFEVFPVAEHPLAFVRRLAPHTWGAEIFRIGVWLSLPLVGMLLFTNLALGLISRVAQQLSIFSIGFPLTLTVGLLGVFATLPMMAQPFLTAIQRMTALFQ